MGRLLNHQGAHVLKLANVFKRLNSGLLGSRVGWRAEWKTAASPAVEKEPRMTSGVPLVPSSTSFQKQSSNLKPGRGISKAYGKTMGKPGDTLGFVRWGFPPLLPRVPQKRTAGCNPVMVTFVITDPERGGLQFNCSQQSRPWQTQTICQKDRYKADRSITEWESILETT